MPVLTPISVQNYRAKAKRREIPDSKAQGLFLIIQPSGRKSWAVRLRRPNGKTAKITLGRANDSEIEPTDAPQQGAAMTLLQAREMAAQIDRQRARGVVDVVAERKAEKLRQRDAAVDRAASTFGAAIRSFFIHYKTSAKHGGKRPRRWREDASLLGLKYPLNADPKTTEPEVIPGSLADVWKDRPLADIDKFTVDAIIDEAKRRKWGRGRKLYSVLSVLFGQLPLKIRPVNPVLGVKRPGPPASRKRKLDDAEIVIFWKACDKVGGAFGPLFKLLLLTGCRLREVSGMQQDELSHAISPSTLLVESTSWTIPGDRTKNHRTHTLPLPQLALDIIASVPVPPINPSGLVFTHNGKTPVSDFSKTKKLLDVEMTKIAGKPVPPWRLHDLRRSFASGLAALGVPLPVTEKLLNHVSGSFGGIVDVYQQYNFDSEKTDALVRWAAHLQGLLSDKPSNIAKLPRRKQGQ
jgi:integrase